MTEARDDLVARVTRNLEQVRSAIAATGRDPGEVTVVAVTKTFGPDAVRAALAAGLRDVAESYAQELVETHDAVGAALATWHFVGRLQRNKLARLAPRVDVYQSVAAGGEATAVAQRSPGARCYVQVDVTGAAGRNGCDPAQAGSVVAQATDAGLVVEGLMCVASPDATLAASQFQGLRRLADELGLAGCSMGMSADYQAACAAGATMVRLGTALFGSRPSRPSPAVA